MATKLNFHIHKFSYGTAEPAKSNNIAWTHLVSDDLVVLLNQDQISGKLELRVIERTDVLELVDLGPLIDTSLTAYRQAADVGRHLAMQQLPTFAITKDTSVAIKYCQQDGMVRSLQMRLRTTGDTEQVLDVLKRRGMEINHKRPATGRPETASSQNHLLTATSSSPYFRQPHTIPRRGVFHLAPLEAGSLSRMNPGVRKLNPQASGHPTSTQAPELARTVVQKDAAFSYIALQPSINLSQAIRPSTSPVKNDRTYRAFADDSSSHLPDSSSTLRASSTVQPPLLERLDSDGSAYRQQTLQTNNKEVEKQTSRPTTASLELPPLRKPKAKQTVGVPDSLNTQDVGIDFRQRTISPPKSSITASDDEDRPRDSSNLLTSQKSFLSPMEALLARRPGEERSNGNGAGRVSSLVDAPHEVVSPPASSYNTAATSLAPQTVGKDFTIRPTAAGSSHEYETYGLTSYASQSREDRTAALDEFMMSMLEDPSFTVLCQDVENCWRRIALGL